MSITTQQQLTALQIIIVMKIEQYSNLTFAEIMEEVSQYRKFSKNSIRTHLKTLLKLKVIKSSPTQNDQRMVLYSKEVY
jgi:predicted transcriptional regulator